MTRLRFLMALAVMVTCFLLLVGSDASVTPVLNTILVIIYVASAAIAIHNALEVRHEA
jgi:hypothetical protein